MNAKIKEIINFSGMAVVAVILGLGTAKLIPVFFPGIVPPLTVTGDYHTYFPSTSVKVVVYGTAWCQYCKKTRAYFKAHNIEFADYDVEKSKVAGDQYMALGGVSFPLVLIGNTKIAGYSPPDFDAALQQIK